MDPRCNPNSLKLILMFMVLLFCALTGLSANSQEELSPVTKAPNTPPLRLAVLLNYAADPTLTAEVLVAAINAQPPRGRSEELRRRFHEPKSASLLITKRLPQSYRGTLPANDPDELLQRYVVLDYPSNADALRAEQQIANDPGVLSVQHSVFASFIVSPADPNYAFAPNVQDYQWGINNPLNLQAAWDDVRGTGYVGHLDNGIQTAPVHEDLGQAWRPQFTFNVAGSADVDENPNAARDVAGHGSHTAGVIAADTSNPTAQPGYPNPPPVGGAGVCWYCSLMVAKISRILDGLIVIDQTVDVPNAINWAVTSGAQTLNLSIGGPDQLCSVQPDRTYCLALDSASLKEVAIAASAGNSDAHVGGEGFELGTILDFPASATQTIAVGGIQSYSGTRGNLWTEENFRAGFIGSSTGPGMETRGVLAPARDVLSTFYYTKNWDIYGRCGSASSFPVGPGTDKGPNYGICTGTSMAAPHITGIVGLMRTVNPLLTATEIRAMLLNSGDNAATPNQERGFGVPNAAVAVGNVLATTNRLTPLFSSFSAQAGDHFYTVVPQMGRAAYAYGLLPNAVNATRYQPKGTPIAEYPLFPHPEVIDFVQPQAEVWVFSTHNNPANPARELFPLYRLSWKCGDSANPVCATNPYHVSHFYTTNLAEAQDYISNAFYKLDGIEGYVFPDGEPGTTTLKRAYNSTLDDYAIFPAEKQTEYESQGYLYFSTNLGYVYLNNGSRPMYRF